MNQSERNLGKLKIASIREGFLEFQGRIILWPKFEEQGKSVSRCRIRVQNRILRKFGSPRKRNRHKEFIQDNNIYIIQFQARCFQRTNRMTTSKFCYISHLIYRIEIKRKGMIFNPLFFHLNGHSIRSKLIFTNIREPDST